MEDALKALDSDEDFGSDAEDDFYVQDELPVIKTTASNQRDLSVDFLNLTISDHGLIPPSVPVAPANTIAAPYLHESTPAATRRVTFQSESRVHESSRFCDIPAIAAPRVHESTPAPTLIAPVPARRVTPITASDLRVHGSSHLHDIPAIIHESTFAEAVLAHRVTPRPIAASELHVHGSSHFRDIPTIAAPRVHESTPAPTLTAPAEVVPACRVAPRPAYTIAASHVSESTSQIHELPTITACHVRESIPASTIAASQVSKYTRTNAFPLHETTSADVLSIITAIPPTPSKKKPSRGPTRTGFGRPSASGSSNILDLQKVSLFNNHISFLFNILPQDPAAGSSMGHGVAKDAENSGHSNTDLQQLLQVAKSY